MAAALVNARLFAAASEFMMGQLFELAAVARCGTMATTETTAKEIILERMLLVPELSRLYASSSAENRQINEEEWYWSNISFKV